MAYALFAQRKLVLTGELNNCQLLQTQRSNDQYALATQTLNLQQQLTSMNSSQSSELSELYQLLSAVGSDEGFASKGDSSSDDYDQDSYDNLSTIAAKYGLDENATRDDVNAIINSKEADYEAETDSINRDIYEVSVKENAIEMEVKRLDTMVTTLQQQLDAVEDAEGSGIESATPKFSGVS